VPPRVERVPLDEEVLEPCFRRPGCGALRGYVQLRSRLVMVTFARPGELPVPPGCGGHQSGRRMPIGQAEHNPGDSGGEPAVGVQRGEPHPGLTIRSPDVGADVHLAERRRAQGRRHRGQGARHSQIRHGEGHKTHPGIPSEGFGSQPRGEQGGHLIDADRPVGPDDVAPPLGHHDTRSRGPFSSVSPGHGGSARPIDPLGPGR
jgi:hypothetical protein